MHILLTSDDLLVSFRKKGIERTCPTFIGSLSPAPSIRLSRGHVPAYENTDVSCVCVYAGQTEGPLYQRMPNCLRRVTCVERAN